MQTGHVTCTKILKKYYKIADLQESAISNCTYRPATCQQRLMILFTKYEDILCGKLGLWDIKPVYF